MDTRWTKGMDAERAKSFIDLLNNSTAVFTKLKAILKDEEEAIARQECSDYRDPSWSHVQAHRNGDRAAIRRVLKLLDFVRD